MLIGTDYPKIEFTMFGLDLVEPNAFIGDIIIFSVAWYFYRKISKMPTGTTDDFLKNWRYFYLAFGISFLVGGFGHLLYNYTQVPGKIPSWLISMLAPFFIEQAMFSIYPKAEKRTLYKRLSLIKLIVFLLLEIGFLSMYDISDKPEKGLVLPTMSTTIGLIICLGVLGVYYQKKIHESFRFLWISMLLLLFSGLPQSFKFNIHQYFDRNDVSHILLLIALITYFQTIKNRKSFKLE